MKEMNLDEWMISYLDYLQYERKLSKNTIYSYQNNLKIYQTFLKSKKSISCTSKDIEDFLKYISKKNPSTKAHYLTVINSFYKFLISDNKINKNPCESITHPKLPQKIPHYLTIEEIDKLLDIPLKTAFDYRNKAMLELLYATGMRITELIQLKIQDIDLEEDFVRVLGKGNKTRIIPINNISKKYLIKYINEYRPLLLKKTTSEFLFINNHKKGISRVGFLKF